MSLKLIKDKMYNNDAFSKWLGIDIVAVENGNCTLRMEVKEEMLNGFKIAHGGITFSLADSALAFASNSFGHQAVSIETSISHLAQVKEGDELIAKTELKNKTRKFAKYTVNITNQDAILVAIFNGTVYYTGKEL